MDAIARRHVPQLSQLRWWSQRVTFRGATREGRLLFWLTCLSQIPDSFVRDSP